MTRWSIVAAALVLSGSLAAAARIVPIRQPGQGGQGGPGSVNLPYAAGQADSSGNIWYIYQGGQLRQQGNMPGYAEGGMIIVNGQMPQANTNQARVEDNGDLVLDNLQCGQCTVTRRVTFAKDGSVRFIDLFNNPTAQPLNLQITYRSQMNYGVQSAETLNDPVKKDQAMAVIVTDGQGRGELELYAGKGAKVVPTFQPQQGNNYVMTSFALPVPAGKSAGLVHVHAVAANSEGAKTVLEGYKDSHLMDGVSREVRSAVANAGGSTTLLEDVEFIRGDMFDVIEVRGGDQFRGTLKETIWKVQTFYGPVELSPDKVISMNCVGKYRPRQLLITSDGEIFGGHLEKEAVQLQLSSGQVTSIPLSQITRLGYRKRADEKEEFPADKPIVRLRSGDRMVVALPEAPLAAMTCYGAVQIPSASIASVAFQSPDSGVHIITLTDGSVFCGLLTASEFGMKLGGTGQAVKLPAGNVATFQFKAAPDDIDDSAARLTLNNKDALIGSVTGQLKLDTAFDTLALNAAELKHITHVKGSNTDVQVTLWDGSTASGQLQEQELSCKLKSGLELKVPLAMLDEYTQPRPAPSSTMTQTMQDLVKLLGSDNWKERDRAQAELLKMGTAAISVLKDARAAQNPEAQQRIDTVIGELEKNGKSGPAATPQPMPMIDD